ncbi:MAG: hypothetical protein JW942_07835 [Opitutales bacterium]|nr:hypothetical protein [Opitutales bacterium]
MEALQTAIETWTTSALTVAGGVITTAAGIWLLYVGARVVKRALTSVIGR